MYILSLVLFFALVGQSSAQFNAPSVFPARQNCFRRSICGGRMDGPACVNNTAATYCLEGQETGTKRCFSCVNGACYCPHCSRTNSTGQCDSITGACECLPGYFGERCQFDTPCTDKNNLYFCFGAVNFTTAPAYYASLASAPNVLTYCFPSKGIRRYPCVSTCSQEGNYGSCACPNNCGGHGNCLTTMGSCDCEIGWGGFDCTVPLFNRITFCDSVRPFTTTCLLHNASLVYLVFCGSAGVTNQVRCSSNSCISSPASRSAVCETDTSTPCPTSFFGACLCGPISGRLPCDTDEYCPYQWDGTFCPNSTTLLSCYGGRQISSITCLASEVCQQISFNDAICANTASAVVAATTSAAVNQEPTMDPFAPDESDPNLPWPPKGELDFFPNYHRCASRWSPNVCISDVVLQECSTYNTYSCNRRCIQTDTGAECECDCGDGAAHQCSKLTGLCTCSVGWTSCPPGYSGRDCSIRDVCAFEQSSTAQCNVTSSVLNRCHHAYSVYNVTCAYGCTSRGDCNCAFGVDCAYGYCNVAGECVCIPGFTGRDCSQGGECYVRRDGFHCINATHASACFKGELVSTISCAPGYCSKKCETACCPAGDQSTMMELFSSPHAASTAVAVTFGIVCILLIVAAALYAGISAGGFKLTARQEYQLQVYDSSIPTDSHVSDEQEDLHTETTPPLRGDTVAQTAAES